MLRKGAEFYCGKRSPPTGDGFLIALMAAMEKAGDKTYQSSTYEGKWQYLVMFGVGADMHDAARRKHIRAGGKALLFDIGYFGRAKLDGHVRFSVNTDHPQELLDRISLDSSRWDAIGSPLREDADPKGHIVLVGLGEKSRSYLGNVQWEQKKYQELVKRFPSSEIVYRPKKVDDPLMLPCSRSALPVTIEQVIKGARLVVCRHSNVAIDAAIAGVPFEAEDGAAMWLSKREFTVANRIEFLQRLAWFNWNAKEAPEAWQFIKAIA